MQKEKRESNAGKTPPAEMLGQILDRWEKGTAVENIVELTPDASMRRYYRIAISTGKGDRTGTGLRSLVAMVFESLQSPEHEGADALPADQCYIQLSEFFSHHGVEVPKLYYDASDRGVLLIEDLGDTMLAEVLLARNSPERSKGSRSSDEEIRRLFRAAIDQIVLIQAIPPDEGVIAFRRGFGALQYVNEMREFSDYIVSPIAKDERQRAEFGVLLERSYDLIAARLEALPRVLAHRDFHPWNLMVDSSGALRVIDFQDALLATESYDAVGLLNDRDVDSALGPDLYLEMVRYFRQCKNSPPDFYLNYQLVLLQRDLKVAGRFAKLSSLRGLSQYERWIPGTLRRIGRNLSSLTAGRSAEFKDLVELLGACSRIIPEIARGAESPLIFE